VAWLHARRHPLAWAATATVGLLLVVGMAGSLVVIGMAFLPVPAGFLIVGVLLTGLGVDGGASVGTSDESRDVVRS
jgi:hypothetical protein